MKASFGRRSLSVLLSMLLIIQAGALLFPAAAAETYSGVAGDLNWTWVDGTLTLTGTGSTGNWEASFPGVAAADRPWSNLRGVTSAIVVGEGVTEIGELAFFGFSGLVSVSLPSTLTAIQKMVFARCFALRELELPASVSVIGQEAFIQSGLQKITALGQAPTVISNEAGTHPCDGLNYDLYTPYGNQTWTAACLGQWGGTPHQIRYAGGSCGVNAVWRLEDDTLTISGTGATATYTYALDYPWEDYVSFITHVVVEEGITELGNYSFCQMTALTRVELPYTLNRIQTRAFKGCTGLSELTIWGGSASGLAGYEAFVGSGITDLWYLGGAPDNISTTKPCTGLTCTLHVPLGDSSWTTDKITAMGGTLTKVEASTIGSCGTDARWRYDNGVLKIKGSGATADYTVSKDYPWKNLSGSITGLVVGENITELGTHTCYQLTALCDVQLPATLNRIQSRCFNGCTSLTSLRIRGAGAGGLAGYAAFVDSGITDLWYEGGAPATISGTAPCDGLTYTLHIPKGDASWTTAKIAAMGGTATVKEVEDALPIYLPFYGYSLSLAENLRINFYVEKDLVLDQGLTGLAVQFSFDGVSSGTAVWEEVTQDGRALYRVTFRNVAPYRMGKTLTATLLAQRGGEPISGDTVSVSAAGYCQAQLALTDDDALRTLLVDLLNFGAAMQSYVSYDTEHLVNSFLTAQQQDWGTDTDPDLASYLDPAAVSVTSPEAFWKGASLVLGDAVSMRFYACLDNLSGVTAVVEDLQENEIAVIPASSFTDTGTIYGYAVTFSYLNAAQLRDIVRVTIKRNGTAVSDTLQYSVESYAYAKQNDESLSALCLAMMRYGDAAGVYTDHTVTSLCQALAAVEAAEGQPLSQEKLTEFFAARDRDGIVRLTLSGAPFIRSRGAQIFLADVKSSYVSRMPNAVFEQMTEVARTYVRNASNLVYGNMNTAFNAVTTNQIDCSSFVQLALSGVPYDSSRYVCGANTARYDFGFSFPDNPYNNTYGTGRYLANELAHFAADREFAFIPASDGSDLRPGDVLFFSTNTDNDFYRHITHTVIFLGLEAGESVRVLHGNNYDVASEYVIRLTAPYTPAGSPNPYQNALVLAARFPLAPDNSPFSHLPIETS